MFAAVKMCLLEDVHIDEVVCATVGAIVKQALQTIFKSTKKLQTNFKRHSNQQKPQLSLTPPHTLFRKRDFRSESNNDCLILSESLLLDKECGGMAKV